MDRDFLFGVIAVQLRQATPGQVMAAASAHFAEPSKSMADRLRAECDLDEERFRMLRTMVDEAVKAHGGDVSKTMQSLGGEQVLYSSFGGSLVQDEQGKLSIAPKTESAGDSIEDTMAVTPEASGRYRLEGDEVGRGGIGRVLIAFDEHLGREIAVKELLADTTEGPPPSVAADALSKTGALVARFLREARVTGQLEHPNIMPVYELGQRESGAFYYTMKLVRGRTLSDALGDGKTLADRLKLLHHYVNICHAIAYAHDRGVIHRDIKPDNVMLGEFGETVVIDWGLAKVRGKRDIRGGELERELKLLHDQAAGKTVVGSAIGTPAYMSPEQADGAVDEIDEGSDIWSLGAVLYELLTGRPPFEGVTPFEIIGKVLKDEVVPPREVDETVPAELSAVAYKALSRDKTKRYPSAAELAADIEAFMSGGRIAAYEYSSWELLRSFVSRHKAVSALSVVIAALVLASSIVLYQAYRRAEAERTRALQSEQRALDNEQQAKLNLAVAFQEKADRLRSEHRVLASRIYSAAALVHHPCNRLGLDSSTACDDRFAAGSKLRLEAVSNVYQQSLHVLARPEWVHRGTDPFEQVVASRDGQRLLTLDLAAKIQLWDVAARKPLISLTGSPAVKKYRIGRSLIALSPDGKLIAASEPSDSIGLWDDAGKRVGTLEQKGSDHYLVFSRDNTILAATGRDGRVVLWDLKTRTAVQSFETGYQNVLRIALSADGTRVAATPLGRILVWGTAEGELLSTIKDADGTVCLAFSPDGRELAAGTNRRTIEIADVETGTRRKTLRGHGEGVSSVQYSDDGKHLLSASSDRTLRFWDGETYDLLYVLEGHQSPIRDARFVPAQPLVASVSADETLRLWRLDTKGMAPLLRGHTAEIWKLAVSPDGRLASAADERMLRLWDLHTARQIRAIGGQAVKHTNVAFSADGKMLLAAGAAKDGTKQATIFDAASGEALRSIDAQAWIAAWSPDGHLVATRSMEGTTRLWDAESTAPIRTLETDGAGQGDVLFSPDGRLLATGGADNTIRLWEVATGKRAKTLRGHPDVPYSFAFSAEGRQLLSGGKEGHILLWDVAGGTKVREFAGHQRWVNKVTYVPGRPLFASASDEATVRLWSLESGESVLIIKTAREAFDCAVTPDGKTLAITDGPGLNQIKLYPIDLGVRDADPDKLLEQAQAEAGLELKGFLLEPKK